MDGWRARPRSLTAIRCGALLLLALAAAALAGCGSSKKKSTAPGRPSVALLTPNGGENLYGGVAYAITWSAEDPDTPAENLRIALDYSTDGGSDWTVIAEEQPNSGSYSWDVPAVVTNSGLVRITASDGANVGRDQSDAVFNINPPPPQYVLSLENATGAPQEEVPVPLALTSAGAVRLLHTEVRFDAAIAAFSGAVAAGRAAGMDLLALPGAAGTLVLDMEASGQDSLPAGDGPVAILSFRLVGENHTETSLTLADAILLDTRGDTLETRLGTGVLRIEASADSMVGMGWELFEAGQLNQALQAFEAAIAEQPGNGPAHAGEGWCRLGLATGPAGLDSARASFDRAAARGQTGAEVLSGRAAASLGLGGARLSDALTDAAAALAAAPEFVFIHRTSFDSRDLRLIEAFARTGQGDIDGALAAADAVEPSGIRRDDPATWIVEGTTYGAFEAAVLARLYKLSDQYSG